jgi:hypothetical protein
METAQLPRLTLLSPLPHLTKMFTTAAAIGLTQIAWFFKKTPRIAYHLIAYDLWRAYICFISANLSLSILHNLLKKFVAQRRVSVLWLSNQS